MRIAFGIIGKDLTVNNISDYIFERKLLISSSGGSLFDGWAIHDFLKGKVDEIGVVGVCASAATLILLAAPIRWATPNARILIHNPYTGIEGDATAVQQVANDLKIEQTILLKRYVEMTGVDELRLQTLMNKNIFLTPEEAMNINLISKIKPQIDNMEQKQKFGIIQNTFRAVSKLLGISNLVLSDINGNELDFGSEVADLSQLKKGSQISVNGSPAQGIYIMPDGMTIECDKGIVIDVYDTPAPEEIPANKQAAEANAKNVILSAEIAKLKAEKLAVETEFLEFKAKTTGEFLALKNDFNSFKGEFSNSKPIANVPTEETKPSNYKKIIFK